MTKTNIQVFQLWHCGCDCIMRKFSSIKVRFRIWETDFNFKSLQVFCVTKVTAFLCSSAYYSNTCEVRTMFPHTCGNCILRFSKTSTIWCDGLKWFPWVRSESVCLWRFQFIWKPESRVLNMLGLFPDLSFPYLLLIILQFPVYHSMVFYVFQSAEIIRVPAGTPAMIKLKDHMLAQQDKVTYKLFSFFLFLKRRTDLISQEQFLWKG